MHETVKDSVEEGGESGKRVLLAEALAVREQYRANREEWIDWDAFKAELKAAEAEERC